MVKYSFFSTVQFAWRATLSKQNKINEIKKNTSAPILSARMRVCEPLHINKENSLCTIYIRHISDKHGEKRDQLIHEINGQINNSQ